MGGGPRTAGAARANPHGQPARGRPRRRTTRAVVRVRIAGACARQRRRALLSGPWLLRAAVQLPSDHALVRRGAAAAASRFGDVHRRWLQAQGIGAAALYAGRPTPHCASFGARAPGEVVVGERKLVGIALAWAPDSVLLSSRILLGRLPCPCSARRCTVPSPRPLCSRHRASARPIAWGGRSMPGAGPMTRAARLGSRCRCGGDASRRRPGPYGGSHLANSMPLSGDLGAC